MLQGCSTGRCKRFLHQPQAWPSKRGMTDSAARSQEELERWDWVLIILVQGLVGPIQGLSHRKEKRRNNASALSEKGHAAKLQIRLNQAAGIKSWDGQGLMRRQMVAAARGRY